MAQYQTTVYGNVPQTQGRKQFTIGLRVFSVDTLNLYYSTNVVSPAPADVLLGATLVSPNDYSVEGVNAAANAVTLVWPDAPATGTLIAELIGNANRISSFLSNQAFPIKALDDELNHFLSLITGVQAEAITAQSKSLNKNLAETAWAGEALPLSDLGTGALPTDALQKQQILAEIQAAVQDVTGLGFPSFIGNALKPVRVNALENGVEYGVITSPNLQSDVAVDANRAVTTDHIRDLAVSLAKIANMIGTSVIARAANSVGGAVALQATANGTYLQRKANLLQFLGLDGADLLNNSVALDRLNDIAARSVVGNATALVGSPGTMEALTDKDILRRAGATIGFGPLVDAVVAGSLTGPMLRARFLDFNIVIDETNIAAGGSTDGDGNLDQGEAVALALPNADERLYFDVHIQTTNFGADHSDFLTRLIGTSNSRPSFAQVVNQSGGNSLGGTFNMRAYYIGRAAD